MTPKFIHLRIHSEYSLVDGIVRVKPLIDTVHEAKMPAVAITDLNNLFAVVKFYKAATSKGIKPIVGSDVLFENASDPSELFHVTLLCKDKIGYQNLTRLVSRAYTEGQTLGTPRIKKSWLVGNSSGLIAISPMRNGDISQELSKGKEDAAKKLLNTWKELFPDSFYFEITRTGRLNEENLLKSILKFADSTDIPVVATNDVCFLKPDDFDAHEARVCIHSGYVLADPRRPKNYSSQQYLRTVDEMEKLFSDLPEALENSVEIAKRCNLEIELYKTALPRYQTPDDMSAEEYLELKSNEGLENHLKHILNENDENYQTQKKEYEERLKLELNVINTMGFPGYFLIVADFINWSIQNNIPVGPGRGSGAGSLVAYALGITGLNPLEYALLFERFLNPERVSMPDFDIDFCIEGRDRVIEYVAEKYGRNSVSQIITYGSMAAKAAIRDVGRVLSHPYGFVDTIAKLIPFELGITIEKAMEQEEELSNRYKKEEEVKLLIDLALKLEGITRNAGKHAGGVVIAPSQLTDFAPLYCEQGSPQIVTQFDKDDVEAVGLVKFDFLGLRTLTIIKWSLEIINAIKKKNNETPIEIEKIPLDDKATFDLLKQCKTTAVFQLESRGMKDLIDRLEPDSFEEIIALVALFRPGPLQSGMVDDFIDRKHGRAQVEFLHPMLEDILKPTYGVILYQEQVMEIAKVLSGYTLGAADLLRRAMGKKKPEEMAKQRDIFVKGAVENNVTEETAAYIFDIIEKFSGYGFNKSHSAAYALIAYQTAWLKTHYPAAFMAAVLSSDMDNTEKVVIFIEDARSLNLKIIPPNINQSEYKFTVMDEKTICYGLGAIKGVGEAAIQIICDERKKAGNFKSLFDFCQRLDLRKVNRRVLQALIKSGALDCFDVHRASLDASIDQAMKMAEQTSKNSEQGIADLFASENDQMINVEYSKAEHWTLIERLTAEKETLGFYLTGHPMQRYQREVRQFITAPLKALTIQNTGLAIIAGQLLNIRRIFTKRGKKMAILTIDDGDARLDVTLFSETLEKYHEILIKDQIFVIEGELSIDDYNGGLRMVASRVWNMDSARETFAKQLLLKLDECDLTKELMSSIKSNLNEFRSGTCPIGIQYKQNNVKAKLMFADEWRVKPSDKLIDNLMKILKKDQLEVLY